MKYFNIIFITLVVLGFSSNAVSSTKSMGTLEDECSDKNGNSCRLLGSKYIFGKSKNHESAVKYYKKACDLNDAAACRMLWIWHSQGAFHKVKLNKKKASGFRRKAEKSGMKPKNREAAEASIQLGFDYLHGTYGIKKNKTKAVKFFKYGIDYMQGACEKGDSKSCKRVKSLLAGSPMSQFSSKLVSKSSESKDSGNPTYDQKKFIRFLDAYNKVVSRNGNDTSAMRSVKERKFQRSQMKKTIRFKKLCLKDVSGGTMTYMAGDNHCSYKATFIVPFEEGSCRSYDRNTGYHAPKVVLEGICKKQALKYQKGKKYSVKGKLTRYHIFRPDDDKDHFTKKYFSQPGMVFNLKK